MKAHLTSEQHLVSSLYQPILFGSLSFAFLAFALPLYGKSLGASALAIGGLFSMHSIVVVVLRPVVGWALDRFGRKVFFTAALACYAGSMGVFAAASSMTGLYLGQLVRGLGSAMLWVSAYTLATDLAASHERGSAIGHVNEAGARGELLGGIAGFILISWLPPNIGWQVVFTSYSLLAALGAWLSWKNLPETGHRQAAQIEHERRISEQLFKLMAVVFVTTVSAAMIAPLFLVFLQDRFTSDVRTLVLAVIPGGIVASYLSSRLGRLSDRYGRIRLMALGLVGSAVVSAVLPVLPGVLWLSVFWAFESIGWAIAGPAEAALIADLTDYDVRGMGYGVYTFVASLGATVGPLVGGWLYDRAGHTAPFYLNAAVLLVGAILVVFLLTPSSRAATEIC